MSNEREDMAETIHKARWPADRKMAITPFADEDRSGREYCFRIADAILARHAAFAATPASREAVAHIIRSQLGCTILEAGVVAEAILALHSPPSGSAGAMREALQWIADQREAAGVRVSDICTVADRALAAPQAQENWIDQNYQIDRYGVALMMIREGCADPTGFARRVLAEFGDSPHSRPQHPPTENTAAGEASKPPPDR